MNDNSKLQHCFLLPSQQYGILIFPSGYPQIFFTILPQAFGIFRLKWGQCYSTGTSGNKMVRNRKQDKPKHLLFGKAMQMNLLFQNDKSPSTVILTGKQTV